MEELRDKVAVITGAASGIGYAMAERFAAEGMKLVLADVEEPALDAATKSLLDQGAEVLSVPTDVSDAPAVEALGGAALERFGSYHVVCNNAGVGGRGFTTWEEPLTSWEWVLGVNLWGVIHGCRFLVPPLVAQDAGHVVNTASIAALGAIGNVGPYNASKHAVLAISETMHHELAARSSNVGVTVVCPGFVNTAIYESERNWPERLGELPESTDPEVVAMRAFINELIPAGAPPSAVADLAVDAIRTRRFLVTTELDMARQAVAIRRDEVEGSPPVNPLV